MEGEHLSAVVPLQLQLPQSLTSPFATRQKVALIELTYLARQWQPADDPPLYAPYMASSEVDQKFLGYFAKTTSTENNYLSSFLFRILGLSVILSEQLLRARKARRLDPVRDPKARHLIHHILWLAREGLIMVEQYILPMVGNYIELKVLSYKLRASFYHIFVLFHNDPAVNDRIVRSRSASTSSAGVAGTYGLFPHPLAPRSNKSHSPSSQNPIRSPSGRQRSPTISLGGAMSSRLTQQDKAPPGLGVPTPFSTNPYSTILPSHNAQSSKSQLDPSVAAYLLPIADYTPHATAAFAAAATLADTLLPGSHPVRLSVKVEYVAYVYDCLKEGEVSRRMARSAIRDVYQATEGMDDDSFEDAAELVGILGKMMKRGLGGGDSASVAGGSVASGSRKNSSTPRHSAVKNGDPVKPHRSTNSASIPQPVARSKNSGTGRPRNDVRRGQKSPPAQQPTTWV